MSLPILPDYIPSTTGSLHDEIKIRNMNVVISLIHNNPNVFGKLDDEKSKLRIADQFYNLLNNIDGLLQFEKQN